MRDTRALLQQSDFPQIRRTALTTLQVNLGYRCNQQCLHCHVNANPKRKEQMSRETVDEVLRIIEGHSIETLDLTGGAPELNPHFRYLVSAARELGAQVLDRCNLTILSEPGQGDLAEFLAQQRVQVIASMPCYLPENVDAQRGEGVYARSILGLQRLNALGYGMPDSSLLLNLVYNPGGAVLPPPQGQLELDYKRELRGRFGIEFNQLFSLANMPIKRFGSSLLQRGEFASYMHLLKSAHQVENLSTVMCRSLLSVDWQGYLYDCDFNQMLDMPLQVRGLAKTHLRDLRQQDLKNLPITVAEHCYGCTAGQGSSCGGALSEIR